MIAPHQLGGSPSTIGLTIDLPGWMLCGAVFVFGTICGSFLNVCVHRLPQHPHGRFWPALRSLWSPPSRCPRCLTPIRWYDNVPVFGWIMLRGRCRTCRMWISPQYPLIEFLNGALLLLLYWAEVPLGWHAPLTESCVYSAIGPQSVPGLGTLSPETWIHLRFFYHVVLVEALLAASLIDLRLMIIPDTVTLPAMSLGLIGAAAVGRLGIIPVWFEEPRLAREFRYVGPDWLQWMVGDGPPIPPWIAAHPHWHGLAVSLAGLAVGAGVVWIVRIVGTWGLRREAMGDGDIVLMGMIGAFIGWQPVLIAFFLAPVMVFAVWLLRLPLRWILRAARKPLRWRDEIPYGPYLALGALATLLSWREIGPWAEQRVFGFGPLLVLFAIVGLFLFAALLLGLQGLKRLLGIPLDWPEEPPAWTAADQTAFFAGEQVDRFTNRWRDQHDWPGGAASRGSVFEDRWRGRR